MQLKTLRSLRQQLLQLRGGLCVFPCVVSRDGSLELPVKGCWLRSSRLRFCKAAQSKTTTQKHQSCANPSAWLGLL